MMEIKTKEEFIKAIQDIVDFKKLKEYEDELYEFKARAEYNEETISDLQFEYIEEIIEHLFDIKRDIDLIEVGE